MIRRALACIIAVVLIGGVAGAATRLGDSTPASPAPTATPTTSADAPPAAPSPTPDATDPLDAVVAELSGFVAGVRGRAFLRPVEVELLDAAAFRARLGLEAVEDAGPEMEEAAVSTRVLRALGLIEAGVDLAEVYQGFLGDAALGFYDSNKEELVLRGEELNPFVLGTLVHELTHAFDDQHFDLDRPELAEADDESFLAFQSLYEGNAVRVESVWQSGLDDDDKRAYTAAQAELGTDVDVTSIPEFLIGYVTFPYTTGTEFVEALVAEGGEAAVDEAFRTPPTSSEHIIDPAGWLDGESIRPVDPPEADGEIIDAGSYGMATLVFTLLDDLGISRALEAAEGWGGDAYVAWDDGEDTCVRSRFVMDTVADLSELTDALVEWAEDQPDAEVETGAGQTTFTACG